MEFPELRDFSHSVITPFGHNTVVGDGFFAAASSFASATFPSSNRAYYYPFWIDDILTAYKFAWWNGTVVSGNVSMSIYDIGKNQLVEAHVAQSGTSALQVLDCTDTVLNPGNYYLGLSMDNTTGTLFRSIQPTIQIQQACGVQTGATAYPLPNPAVFSGTTPAGSYVIACGIATKSVI